MSTCLPLGSCHLVWRMERLGRVGAAETGVRHTVLGIDRSRRTRLPAPAVHGCPLGPHADRPSSGASASKAPQFAARSLSATHGCPLATCARRARMPSGHMRIARPLTYTLHGLHVAPWLPSWPHARALGPPIVSSALTRRAHPLKTPGAMPGKSLEAHRCDITRPLPLRTIVSCLSMSPMPAAHAAAQPNLRIAC